MPKSDAAWREATEDEVAAHLSGEAVWNDHGGLSEVRETPEGLEVLDGTPAPCGCIPHDTRMTGFGFHCATEDQGYCNFECFHEDEDED